MKTPVAVFLYRRPHLTAGLMKLLEAQRPKKIWLVADGPKSEFPEEKVSCAETRRVAEEAIRWPCEVHKVYAETNLGLKQRFESGLDEVFGREAEAIILEDDCHPRPDFIPFCEAMLTRYGREPRVGGISGNCFLPRAIRLDGEYFFSRYLNIWGWATWARAWHSYDRSRWAWPSGGYREYFPHATRREEKYWNRIFARVSACQFSTWDYSWTSWFWREGWVSVTPSQNLVRNVGFGPDATNTRDRDISTGIERENDLSPPYRGPKEIRANDTLDLAVFRNTYLRMEGRRNLSQKIIDRLKRLVSQPTKQT